MPRIQDIASAMPIVPKFLKACKDNPQPLIDAAKSTASIEGKTIYPRARPHKFSEIGLRMDAAVKHDGKRRFVLQVNKGVKDSKCKEWLSKTPRGTHEVLAKSDFDTNVGRR